MTDQGPRTEEIGGVIGPGKEGVTVPDLMRGRDLEKRERDHMTGMHLKGPDHLTDHMTRELDLLRGHMTGRKEEKVYYPIPLTMSTL